MTGHTARMAGLTRAGSAGYVSVLIVGTVTCSLLLQVAPGWTWGPLPGVAYVVLAALVTALVVWWRTPRAAVPDALLAWFLLTWLLLWLVLMALVVARGEEVSVLTILLPLALFLIVRKPPDRAGAFVAADVLAWSAVVGSAVSLTLEASGVVESWYGQTGSSLAREDHAYYWLAVSDLLHLDGRWAGPFVHPNLAGPVGGFLLVYGITRRGASRVVFALSGGLVLLLSASRTSQLAGVVGLLILGAVWWLTRPSSVARWLRILIVAAPALLFAAALVRINPGLSGRTSVWPVMVRLWQESPLFGIGDAGFADAIDSGLLPVWAHHGHNVFFDALVRTGIVGLVLVLVVVLLALIIVVRAARDRQAVGLALVGMLIVGGLADTTLHWRFVTVQVAVFLLAVLVSTRAEPASVAPAPLLQPAPARGIDPGPDPAPTA